MQMSEKVAGILQPVLNLKPNVGSNITPRNPDVEVLALTLNDTPLTMTGFSSMDGGRGWVNTKFLILSVGPPGFSSVPYTHNKKKGDKEVGKKLYEIAEDGSTRFFPYQPGKTNKDRGERVSIEKVEENGDSVERDLTATLLPGMCITNFTRADNYERDGKFIVNPPSEDILPAFSPIYLQLSSSNSEQAGKGRLLKVRRQKIPEESVDWHQLIQGMPATVGEFAAVNSTDKNFSIRENIDSRNRAAYFQFEASKTSFANVEDDMILLCESRPDVEVAMLDPKLLEQHLPSATAAQRLKLFNIALATGAVRVLIRSQQQDDMVVLDSSTDKYPDKVLGLHIDYNVMFGLDLIHAQDLSDLTLSQNIKTQELEMEMDLRGEYQRVVWHKGDVWGGDQRKKLSYSINLEQMEDAGDLPTTFALLDRGAAGPFHELRVHIQDNMTMESLNEQLSRNKSFQCLLTMELRVNNRSASACKKRKRPTLDFEEME